MNVVKGMLVKTRKRLLIASLTMLLAGIWIAWNPLRFLYISRIFDYSVVAIMVSAILFFWATVDVPRRKWISELMRVAIALMAVGIAGWLLILYMAAQVFMSERIESAVSSDGKYEAVIERYIIGGSDNAYKVRIQTGRGIFTRSETVLRTRDEIPPKVAFTEDKSLDIQVEDGNIYKTHFDGWLNVKPAYCFVDGYC